MRSELFGSELHVGYRPTLLHSLQAMLLSPGMGRSRCSEEARGGSSYWALAGAKAGGHSSQKSTVALNGVFQRERQLQAGTLLAEVPARSSMQQHLEEGAGRGPAWPGTTRCCSSSSTTELTAGRAANPHKGTNQLRGDCWQHTAFSESIFKVTSIAFRRSMSWPRTALDIKRKRSVKHASCCPLILAGGPSPPLPAQGISPRRLDVT